jgi:hypothetical protein
MLWDIYVNNLLRETVRANSYTAALNLAKDKYDGVITIIPKTFTGG